MTDLIASVLDVLYQQSIWAGILFPAVLLFAYVFRQAYPGILMAVWLLIPLRLIAPTDLAFEYSLAEWLSKLPLQEVAAAPVADGMANHAVGHHSYGEYAVDSKLGAFEYILFALWLSGSVFCLGRFLNARRQLRGFIKDAEWVRSGDDYEMLEQARAAFGCRRNIKLVISRSSNSAFTVGTVSPIICLPGKLWNELSRSDQQAILYHEVAHVKACDDLLLYGLNLIRCVFFFHPAMCYAQAQISQQRERLTDITVIESGKIKPRQYAKALLNYIEKSTLKRFENVAPGVGGQYLLMKIRIEAMMNNRFKQLLWQKVSALLLMAFMISIVLPMETLAKAELLDNEAAGIQFNKPMENIRISSSFGMRKHPISGKDKFHKGIDLPAALGSKVFAVAGGRVVKVKCKNLNKPNYVFIDHGQGMVSRYFQIDEVRVRENDWVKPGQHIAEIGGPHMGTGPHLHFELYKDDEAVDPLVYLKK
ncbi:peptidoglycan DD-metalloendopeptidase family protein [Pseudoteredinibacter isoporae]|nr:M23/M56 family metallopeptidase [Pseudoteredinibacter isoporae]NHO88019.1 peptidoglycan DD-metalloendopeptidase family protein [Pseudoteredinibacter isoporae]NIB23650.1 peptidoglycan DD-metalloendopeptidase family protein [Pseudoteredinibacter isoporae]